MKHRSWAASKHRAAILPISGSSFWRWPQVAQAAPGNDDFLNAKPLSGVPLSVEFDDNEGASKQAAEPNHAGNAGGHSVWYSWTPSSSGQAIISTCVFFGSFNTLLAVCTGSAVNSLTPVASNGDAADGCGPWTDSEVAFDATVGATYRIAVDGKGGSEGNFKLTFEGSLDGGGGRGATNDSSSAPAPLRRPRPPRARSSRNRSL